MMINEPDSEELTQFVIHYGNLKPSCFRDGQPRYYLGPQLPVFIGNLTITIGLMCLLHYVLVCPWWHRLIGIFLNYCLLFNLVEIGLGQPGLAAMYQMPPALFGQLCIKCRIPKYQRVVHCRTCDVCVADYDHHCIFLGKCIGRNNMESFKSLLVMCFANLIFFAVDNMINSL